MVARADDSVRSATDAIAVLAAGFATGVGCVVGKGPSFERAGLRPDGAVTLAVNQAALDCPGGSPDFAVVTDLDVLTGDYLDRLPCALVLPAYPHVNFRPDRRFGLTELVDRHAGLRRLAVERRLFAYRSDRWPSDWPGPLGPGWPRLRVRGFTAAACVALLHAARIKTVFTAGVDGGRRYHPRFAAQGLTPLTNGQPSFDAQFQEFDRFRRRGVVITPL